MIPACLDGNRDLILDRAAGLLKRMSVPGGCVTAWLAPVPAMLIEHALEEEHPADIASTLMRLVGRFRHADATALRSGFDACDMTNVPQGPFADAALRLWASCTFARLHLDRGAPDAAESVLIPVGRDLPSMPTALIRRFDAWIDALYREARTALAGDLANELA